MRTRLAVARTLLAVAISSVVAGCGSPATSPAAPVELPPLPPDSPTVIGALLARGDELAVSADTLAALEQIDQRLRDEIRPSVADLRDREDELERARRPREPEAGGRGGGGMGGGGGGPGGGGGGMGGGMGGGGPGGGGGGGRPPRGAKGPPRMPPGSGAPRGDGATRYAIEDLRQAIARSQRAAQDEALAIVPVEAQARVQAIIDAYWANERARNAGDQPGHASPDPAP